MIFAIYDPATGEIFKTVDAPPFFIAYIELEDGQALVEIPRQANDATEIIRDGSLVPKDDPETEIAAP